MKELKRTEELGCLIELGIFALVCDAISCIKTGEITVVDFILAPIVVAAVVYWIVCYKHEKGKENGQAEKD